LIELFRYIPQQFIHIDSFMRQVEKHKYISEKFNRPVNQVVVSQELRYNYSLIRQVEYRFPNRWNLKVIHYNALRIFRNIDNLLQSLCEKLVGVNQIIVRLVIWIEIQYFCVTWYHFYFEVFFAFNLHLFICLDVCFGIVLLLWRFPVILTPFLFYFSSLENLLYMNLIII
jgi:hypothetical protein